MQTWSPILFLNVLLVVMDFQNIALANKLGRNVPMKSFGDFGTEKFWNSLWVTKGTSQFLCKSHFFPMNGLAGVVKKKSIMSGEAVNDGFFFTTTAKPWMGKNCDAHRNWNVPWVTNREFFPYQNWQMIVLAFLLG